MCVKVEIVGAHVLYVRILFSLTSLLSQDRLRVVQTLFCVAFIFKHNNSLCVLE